MGMTISSRGPSLEPGMLNVRMGGKTANTPSLLPPAPHLPRGISSDSGWRSWPAWNCLSVSPFLAVADKYILLDKNTSPLREDPQAGNSLSTPSSPGSLALQFRSGCGSWAAPRGPGLPAMAPAMPSDCSWGSSSLDEAVGRVCKTRPPLAPCTSRWG